MPMDFEKLPANKGQMEIAIRPLRLTIRAKDMGTPSLSSDVPVIIYFKDVNDNGPNFERAVYQKNIPEDVPGGTTVLQVIIISFFIYLNKKKRNTRKFTQFFLFSGKSLGQRFIIAKQ